VSELVQQHKRKQGKILENVPNDRGIPALSALDLVGGDEEPRPVEEYINSGKTEEMDGTTAGTEHLHRLRDEADPTEAPPLKVERRHAGYFGLHIYLRASRSELPAASGLTENSSGNIPWTA
jgi:hypothetical protein